MILWTVNAASVHHTDHTARSCTGNAASMNRNHMISAAWLLPAPKFLWCFSWAGSFPPERSLGFASPMALLRRVNSEVGLARGNPSGSMVQLFQTWDSAKSRWIAHSDGDIYALMGISNLGDSWWDLCFHGNIMEYYGIFINPSTWEVFIHWKQIIPSTSNPPIVMKIMAS